MASHFDASPNNCAYSASGWRYISKVCVCVNCIFIELLQTTVQSDFTLNTDNYNALWHRFQIFSVLKSVGIYLNAVFFIIFTNPFECEFDFLSRWFPNVSLHSRIAQIKKHYAPWSICEITREMKERNKNNLFEKFLSRKKSEKKYNKLIRWRLRFKLIMFWRKAFQLNAIASCEFFFCLFVCLLRIWINEIDFKGNSL